MAVQPRLSQRALNRATLARQQLLEREGRRLLAWVAPDDDGYEIVVLAAASA